MNCLNRIEMQEYIDNESTPAEKVERGKHIETCEKCNSLYREAMNDKEQILSLIEEHGSNITSGPVPDFIPPQGKRINKIYLRASALLAAALIIGFVITVHRIRLQKFEKIPEAEMMLYEFYEGKDLNKMWHEKSQIIILQDEKGNVIEPIIVY